jgi:hypothetical protein
MTATHSTNADSALVKQLTPNEESALAMRISLYRTSQTLNLEPE